MNSSNINSFLRFQHLSLTLLYKLPQAYPENLERIMKTFRNLYIFPLEPKKILVPVDILYIPSFAISWTIFLSGADCGNSYVYLWIGGGDCIFFLFFEYKSRLKINSNDIGAKEKRRLAENNVEGFMDFGERKLKDIDAVVGHWRL